MNLNRVKYQKSTSQKIINKTKNRKRKAKKKNKLLSIVIIIQVFGSMCVYIYEYKKTRIYHNGKSTSLIKVKHFRNILQSVKYTQLKHIHTFVHTSVYKCSLVFIVIKEKCQKQFENIDNKMTNCLGHLQILTWSFYL